MAALLVFSAKFVVNYRYMLHYFPVDGCSSCFRWIIFNAWAFRLGVNGIVRVLRRRRRRNEIRDLNNSQTVRHNTFNFYVKIEYDTLHILLNFRSEGVTLTPQNLGTKTTSIELQPNR